MRFGRGRREEGIREEASTAVSDGAVWGVYEVLPEM